MVITHHGARVLSHSDAPGERFHRFVEYEQRRLVVSVQEIEVQHIVHLGIDSRYRYRVARHDVRGLAAAAVTTATTAIVTGTAKRQDKEITTVHGADHAPAVGINADRGRRPVLRVSVLEFVVLEIVQRQRTQRVRVPVVLDQAEFGLGKAKQQGVGRARAQRHGLQAHDVAEQRELGHALELGLGRLTSGVGGYQSVHAQRVHAGHNQAFLGAIEEVTIHGVFGRRRCPRLFAQRKHGVRRRSISLFVVTTANTAAIVGTHRKRREINERVQRPSNATVGKYAGEHVQRTKRTTTRTVYVTRCTR